MGIFNDINDLDRFERKVKPYIVIGFIVASMLSMYRLGEELYRLGEEHEKERQNKEYIAECQNKMNNGDYADVLSRYLENLSRKIPSQLDIMLLNLKGGEEK